MSKNIKSPEEVLANKIIAVITQELSLKEKEERDSLFLLALVVGYEGRRGLAGCDIELRYNTPDNQLLKSRPNSNVPSEFKWNPAYFITTSCWREWATELDNLASHWDSQRLSEGDEDLEEEEDKQQIENIWQLLVSLLSEFKQTPAFEKLLPSCTHILITNGMGQGGGATEKINGPMPDEFWEGSLFYPGD